jgi:hypothetical protein
MSAANDFDLTKCFDFGMVKKNKANLSRLCKVLVEASHLQENGWLMKHFDDTISANKVLLYFSALLASRWQLDSNLLIALRKSVVGDREVVLDKKFLRSILVARRGSEQNQTINELVIEYLVGALDNPKLNSTQINERTGTPAKGWLRSEWFSGSSNKGRFTTIEDKAFQIQVLLTIDTVDCNEQSPEATEKTKKDRQAARDAICQAWGLRSKDWAQYQGLLRAYQGATAIHQTLSSMTLTTQKASDG